MVAVRHVFWLAPLVSVPLVCVSLALAQDEPRKDATGPDRKDEAEVQFANGSTVKMSLAQDKIEVLTRYGKLSIPLAEVQRIDFGVHLSADKAKAVDAAIAKLHSIQYEDREDAIRDLTELGAAAYPALLKAQRSSDPEVARRAEKVLAAIRTRVPDKELRSREDDIIVTPSFTIVGRIQASALKGKSEYFGNVQLQLPQLRQLRPLHNPGEQQFVVDASLYGSAHDQWMDTGLTVETSTALLITATGTIDIYPQTPGQYVSAPKGYGNNLLGSGAKVIATPANMRNYAGALFGRIGDGAEAFYIGERYEGAPGREGRLYLHIVPSQWNNASIGNYQVRIATRN